MKDTIYTQNRELSGFASMKESWKGKIKKCTGI